MTLIEIAPGWLVNFDAIVEVRFDEWPDGEDEDTGEPRKAGCRLSLYTSCGGNERSVSLRDEKAKAAWENIRFAMLS